MQAIEAQEGQVYKTCESELEYFAKMRGKTPDKVLLSAFMPKSGKWKDLEVPNEYKLRELNDTEKEIYAKISEPKAKRTRVPKDPNAPPKVSVSKAVGLINGKGMIASWAMHIDQFATVEGGRSLVIAAMTEEFPQKVESINKWVNAYLTYYNTGRFAHVGFPRKEVHVYWTLSEAEKAAGIQNRNSRAKKQKVEVAVDAPAV
jgi:hypothetical protein